MRLIETDLIGEYFFPYLKLLIKAA